MATTFEGRLTDHFVGLAVLEKKVADLRAVISKLEVDEAKLDESEGAATAPPPAAAAAQELPGGWESAWDQKRMCVFYFNRTTGDSSWMKPQPWQATEEVESEQAARAQAARASKTGENWLRGNGDENTGVVRAHRKEQIEGGDEYTGGEQTFDTYIEFQGGLSQGSKVTVNLDRFFKDWDLIQDPDDWTLECWVKSSAFASTLAEGRIHQVSGALVEIQLEAGVAMTIDIEQMEGRVHEEIRTSEKDDSPWKLLNKEQTQSRLHRYQKGGEMHDHGHYIVDLDAFATSTQGATPKNMLSEEAVYLLENHSKIMAGLDVEFEFLSAAHLRARTDPLPKYQILVREGGWLHSRRISMQGVLKGEYVKKMVVVSHRWFEHNFPFDPEGTKLALIRDFLIKNPEVEDVWIDYCCIPQEEWNDARTVCVVERTPDEAALFGEKLPYINMLYLGLKVLLVVNQDYCVRFWTQFEAYLSFQSLHKYGFLPSSNADTSNLDEHRFHIVFSHPSITNMEAAKERLDILKSCDFDQAVVILEDENTKVTSKKDKDVCMRKLLELKRNMAAIYNTTTDGHLQQ